MAEYRTDNLEVAKVLAALELTKALPPSGIATAEKAATSFKTLYAAVNEAVEGDRREPGALVL